MAQRWEREKSLSQMGERSGREMAQTLGGRVGERWLRDGREMAQRWERDGSESERDGLEMEERWLKDGRDGSEVGEREVGERWLKPWVGEWERDSSESGRETAQSQRWERDGLKYMEREILKRRYKQAREGERDFKETL